MFRDCEGISLIFPFQKLYKLTHFSYQEKRLCFPQPCALSYLTRKHCQATLLLRCSRLREEDLSRKAMKLCLCFWAGLSRCLQHITIISANCKKKKFTKYLFLHGKSEVPAGGAEKSIFPREVAVGKG